MMEKLGIDVFALSETKVRGTGECKFGDVVGRVSGVANGRAREGVAVLVSKRVKERVVEWKEVSSRLMWVKVKWGQEVWVFVSAYGPGSERSADEREDFWTDLADCVEVVGKGCSVVVMGDLNARVGNEEVVNVVGKFGVPGRNESGEKLIEVCMERELVIGNTRFKKKLKHKYTWERVVRGEVTERALMDYVLIDKRMVGRLLDVHVMRGEGGGLSDHYLVKGRLKVCMSGSGGKRVSAKGVAVKVSVLNESEKEREFVEKMSGEYEKVCERTKGEVEEEWESFREAIMRCATEVCGKRVFGRGVRRGSEWWNDRVREVVTEKRRAYERWLQRKDAEAYEQYREVRRRVKRVVREEKRKADERFGRKLSECFEDNKKMFWKEVKRVRKVGEREERVKDVSGNVLVEKAAVSERWAGYFDALLNVKDDRKANVVAVGGEGGMPVFGELNDEEIDKGEVRRELNKMKSGKTPGLDGCAVECLKKGGEAVIEWLVRLLNVCFVAGRVPVDWCSACVVPLYKGKGDRCECGNYRGISLLCVVGKLFGRILIERIRDKTERVLREEQCGFRKGRSCMDQIFTVRQLCEKFVAKGRDVYWAFMDLEKAYDRVDREAMWQVLRVYGVGGRLLRAVQSFYVESRACVRNGSEVSDWFPVKVGLRQGCVMSPWLFNVYMDGVVREVNVRASGRGVSVLGVNGAVCQVSQLLFADDTALVADSEENLRKLVAEFGRVCERRKLKVNIAKSKVMKCSRRVDDDDDGGGGGINVCLNGEKLEEVSEFKYLGSHVADDGSMEREVGYRLGEGSKVLGAVRGVMKGRSLSRNAKRCLYERVIVPTVTYGAETWSMREAERKRLEVFEMRCLRSMVGVTRMDRVRNEEVRRRAGVSVPLSARVDGMMLRWFGHMERMDEGRMVKRVMNSEVSGNRGRGRPRCVWMDGVKRAVEKRGVSVQEARKKASDRGDWRKFVDG